MKETKMEFVEKARQAASAAELLALAKEHGIRLDEAEANAMFEKLAELSDEEIEMAAGGQLRRRLEEPWEPVEPAEPNFI